MRKLALIALAALVVSLPLSGCLVKKKSPVTISRSTDNMRIYQPEDYIVYDVQEQRSAADGTPLYANGTLRIDWIRTDDLPDPNAVGQLIPVLKEVTTLTFNGDSDTEIGTVRYISQDDDPNSPTYGEIRLHAIEAPGQAQKYWLNSDGNLDTLTAPFTVFPSPLAMSGPQSLTPFYLMQGCETNPATCEAVVGSFLDDNFEVVDDTSQITTVMGIFTNLFRVNYSGISQPISLPALPVLLDIRDACGGSQPATTYHNGTMFVMPEIGVIHMLNMCQDDGMNPVIYNISLRDTNIPRP